ncbi:MAG: ribonuclease P protein component [Candidatus Omnitrophota bacterium]|nr:MAG: ribonuclease P protein component [Candidatus Omnitrophota bacterium]
MNPALPKTPKANGTERLRGSSTLQKSAYELRDEKKSGVKPDQSKQQKLRRNRQFREVYMRGRRQSGPLLTLFFMPNKLKLSRMGLSVTKKRFRLSVRRHYIQRRLREAYRLNKMRFLQGYDIVIVARNIKKTTGFGEITAELLSLAQKAKLLKCQA